MESKYYFLLEVNFKNLGEEDYININQIAFEEFNCQGLEEFNLNESQVDKILGKDALLGAEVNEDIIKRIEKSVEGNFSVKYMFLEKPEVISFQSFLGKLKNPPETKLKKSLIEDWNKEWKKHFKPIEISSRLKIIPEWERGEKILEGEILINPGMGFGTGSHETTFLCLKFLNELKLHSGKCLDFGCGSGILGIAAIKLYNFKVDFVDVSKEALKNCHENLILNFNNDVLQGSSVIIRERFHPNEKYDLVFANILLDVLLYEKEIILNSLKKNGILIISGLLNEQKNEFLNKFDEKKSLKVIDLKSKGDWCAILLEKI